MVCAGELEHPLSVFQQSDRCILREHSSCSEATSIISLSSACRHRGSECCLMVCRATSTLMVCAGELEHPLSVFQQSDRCILREHSSCSEATSIISLSSACRHRGSECCLMVCRAAAAIMVRAGKLDLACPLFQSSDGCVLRARKWPLSADVSDSSCLYKHAAWLKMLLDPVQGRYQPHGLC